VLRTDDENAYPESVQRFVDLSIGAQPALLVSSDRLLWFDAGSLEEYGPPCRAGFDECLECVGGTTDCYIAEHDAPARADYVLKRLEKVLERLARFPGRGSYPRELLALGIREYREAFFKPYRVIHRTSGQTVYVYLIADGRRYMQELLLRRLVGA
jgi:toxin ParE1/3/4